MLHVGSGEDYFRPKCLLLLIKIGRSILLSKGATANLGVALGRADQQRVDWNPRNSV